MWGAGSDAERRIVIAAGLATPERSWSGMLISDGGHKNGWGFEVVQLPQVAVGRFSAAVRILFLFAWPGAPVLEMEIAGALA